MRVVITIILFIGFFISFGQTKTKLEGKPKTLEETFIYLDNIFDDTSKYAFMTLPEDVATSRLHMGLGVWIRDNRGLWGHSKLKHYFIEKGVTHPDTKVFGTTFYTMIQQEKLSRPGFRGVIQCNIRLIVYRENLCLNINKTVEIIIKTKYNRKLQP
ncbi:MAG: hypothetical protein NTU44_13955 [Bacteroidetes bacterium]|nr:hypothetical protein [Bacteroidota bacterium]